MMSATRSMHNDERYSQHAQHACDSRARENTHMLAHTDIHHAQSFVSTHACAEDNARAHIRTSDQFTRLFRRVSNFSQEDVVERVLRLRYGEERLLRACVDLYVDGKRVCMICIYTCITTYIIDCIWKRCYIHAHESSAHTKVYLSLKAFADSCTYVHTHLSNPRKKNTHAYIDPYHTTASKRSAWAPRTQAPMRSIQYTKA